MRRWYDNLAGGSPITAVENARVLNRYLTAHGLNPGQLLELAKKDRRAVEDQRSMASRQKREAETTMSSTGSGREECGTISRPDEHVVAKKCRNHDTSGSLTGTLSPWERDTLGMRLKIPISCLLVSVLSIASGAMAVAPCPPLAYAVSFSAPLCNITIESDPALSIGYLWWFNYVNQSYDQASKHLGRTATPTEPVTYRDRDANEMVSHSDVIEVWQGTACGGGFPVRFGPNPTNGTVEQDLFMQDGYHYACGSGGQDLTVWFIVAVVILITVPAVLFLMLRRRRSH